MPLFRRRTKVQRQCSMPVYDQVKQALQDILAPEFQALKTEIRRLEEKIEGLRSGMNAKFSALDTRIDALDVKIGDLRHEVRTVLAIRERLAAVKGQSGDHQAPSHCHRGFPFSVLFPPNKNPSALFRPSLNPGAPFSDPLAPLTRGGFGEGL